MKSNDSQELFIGFGLLLLIFLGIPAFYHAKADVINGLLLLLCKAELRLFVSFSDSAAIGLSKISALDPSNLSWNDMSTVLFFTGKYVRWAFLIILLILGGIGFLLSRTKNLNRNFSMASLLENNAEIFPCMTPVVGRGDYLLSRESYDSGYWKIARSPIQFAAEHNLLCDSQKNPFSLNQILRDGLGYKDMPAWGQAVFDLTAAKKVFTDQLGQPVQEFSAMSAIRKALATSFALYAVGKKEEGVDLLDKLSASYSEENKPECLVLKEASFIKDAEEKFQTILPQLDKSLSRHAFELTWFMELLLLARKKGVLASSQFLFLRPMDRPLWYALNQCGGRTAWTEAAAAWEHYHEEKKYQKAIAEPQVVKAVSGLKKELARQGWLTDTPPGQDVENSDNEDQTHAAYLRRLRLELI